MNAVHVNSKLTGCFLSFKFKGFLFASLLAAQEIKPVEPCTLAIVGAGAITVRALCKTTAGKVFIGYALGQAAQNPVAKYVIARMQNRVGIMLQKRAQENYMTALEVFYAKSVILRARMAAMMPGFTQRTGVRFHESINGKYANLFTSYHKATATKTFRNLTENVADVRNGAQNFKESAAKSQKGTSAWTHVRVNQTNIHQQVNFDKGFTFVSADAATIREFGRAEFWKGVCVGGCSGATAVAWWQKKREDKPICCSQKE